MLNKKVLGLSLLLASTVTSAAGRDTISVVGSSTVYPFTTVVAERFGKSNDFSNGLFNKDQKSEAITGDLYRTKIPWNLTFAHSFTYRNNAGQKDISNNSLMISGDVDLTPKWKVGVSSGYDFKGKGVTYTQFRFDRDLDSWRLNFSWVPFSNRASWYFFIGIKSGLLSDLKYEKRREPDRRL